MSDLIPRDVWHIIMGMVGDGATVAALGRLNQRMRRLVREHFERTQRLVVPWKRVDEAKLAQWPLLPKMRHIHLGNFWLTAHGTLFLHCPELCSLELHCCSSFSLSKLHLPAITALSAKVSTTSHPLELWYGNERMALMDRTDVWSKGANEKPSVLPIYSSSSDDEEAYERLMEKIEDEWGREMAYFNDTEHLLKLCEENAQWEWDVARAEAEDEERLAKRPCTLGPIKQ